MGISWQGGAVGILGEVAMWIFFGKMGCGYSLVRWGCGYSPVRWECGYFSVRWHVGILW